MSVRSEGDGLSEDLPFEMERAAMRTRKGLEDYIEELYEAQYNGLFRYLIHLGASPANADEFIQEAFLRLFQSVLKGNRIEKPRNWLLAVLHHISADESRRTFRQVKLDALDVERWEENNVDPAPSPEAELIHREQAHRLRKSMAQLTERQYQYLLMRTEGLKLREIAEIFGVTVQSVAEICTRAIDRIGRLMHE